MKKKNVFIVMVLGIISMVTTSCAPVMYQTSRPGYDTPRPVVRTPRAYGNRVGTSDAILYEDTPMYSYIGIVGDNRYPNQLIMQNLIISRRGMTLTVTDGTGREVYGSWDLRYRDLIVTKVWHAKDLNGLPIEVTLKLRGTGGNNTCTIKDGARKRTFNMLRH